MAVRPPKIHTYHCLCLSLLLASTHTLSSLPRRSTQSSHPSSDFILPLPPAPLNPSEDEIESTDLPPEGYTLLLGVDKEKKPTIIRREDGFEKRILHRCSRCRLVVGYELATEGDTEMGGTSIKKGKEKEKEEGYTGRIIYILPAAVMSTEAMAAARKIGEEEVDVVKGAIGVFE